MCERAEGRGDAGLEQPEQRITVKGEKERKQTETYTIEK